MQLLKVMHLLQLLLNVAVFVIDVDVVAVDEGVDVVEAEGVDVFDEA